MKLYLIRHGETNANKKHAHNTPQTKLTKEGIKQAKIVAKRFKGVGIDLIYSSPLTRAMQTAEIISKTTKLPIEKWGDIVEVRTASINWGKLEIDKEAADIEKKIAKNYHKGNWRYSDEETFVEIKKRAQKVLLHLLRKHKSQNVLCISHASLIKMIILLSTLGKNLTPEIYIDFREHWRMNNSGVTILEYEQGRGWVTDTWNDKSHL